MLRSAPTLALVALSCLALGALCQNRKPPPTIYIHSPAHGVFTTASTVTVSGELRDFPAGSVQIAAVNGIDVKPLLDPDGFFSVDVSLSAADIFNPIVLFVRQVGNLRYRERVTVIVGDSIADGAFSPQSLALRLDDSGLDQIEPEVTTLVEGGLDLGTLLPPGTVLIDDQCFATVIFCVGWATVRIDNPPPSFSDFGVQVDSQPDYVDGVIDINDVNVYLQIDGSGIVPDCDLRISANVVSLDGSYTLAPDAFDPEIIDVNQQGALGVSFTAFSQHFISGLCDDFLIGDIIQAFIGNLEDDVVNAVQGFLDDPDGGGPADSPVADGIETALAGIQIAGPIGESLGVSLEAPMFMVAEDAAGITIGSDGRITASMPSPTAPDFTESYHVPEVFPTFGATTPVSGLPYHAAISLSSSAFNQLLKAEIESGLLFTSITEIPYAGTLWPLNAGVVTALFFTEFEFYDPGLPLAVDLEPTLAPVITGADGPGGELAELRIGHLLATLRSDDGSGTVHLQVAVDATIGLQPALVNGELAFTLGTISPSDLSITILKNDLEIAEVNIALLLPSVLAEALPSLASALGTFPLPNFLGLELNPVEISKSGQFMSIFADLAATP